jgi:hypothetical protein
MLAAALGLAVGGARPAYASSPAPIWGQASQVVLPSGTNGVNAPATDPRVYVNSVSCWSAGNCAAVGTYVVSSSGGNIEVALLLMELNHVWQPSVEGIDPGVGTFELPSVSCSAGGNCIAVGSYWFSTGETDIRPDYFRASNGAWNQTASPVSLPGDAIPGIAGGSNAGQIAKLSSVSCESAGNCVAVGSYYSTQPASTSGEQTSGMFVTEAGGAWGAGVPVVPPPNSSQVQFVTMNGASCNPSGQCSAVGGYSPSSGGVGFGLALSGTGGTLSAQATQLPLPGDAQAYQSVTVPSVSCDASGNCDAVEGYFATGKSGTWYGLLSRTANTGWANVGGLAGPPPYNAASDIGAAACGGADTCGAAGTGTANSDGSGARSTVGWSGTAGAWTTAGETIQAPTWPPGRLAPTVMSCASAGNCTTVGLITTAVSTYYGFAASEVDGTWQPAVNLQMSFGSASLGPDPLFESISCPDPGDCAAVGYYQSSNQQAFVVDSTSGSSSAPTPTGTTTGTTTPTTPAGRPPHPQVGSPHISGYTVFLPVSCTGGDSCSLTLTLSATETLQASKLLALTAAAKRHRKIVVLGTARLTVAGGKHTTAKVSLNAVGKRLLKSRKMLPLTLTVRQGGKVIASDRLKIKRR